MNKYINADEFQNFLATARLNYPETLKMDWKDGIMFAINAIGGFSSADVVEVIRCKDCKHLRECERACPYTKIEPNDFCSRGERKEQNEQNEIYIK